MTEHGTTHRSHGSTAWNPEDVLEIRKRYGQLGAVTHYEVLGVAKNADRAAVLETYSSLVKRLRPMMERDDLGDDGPRLDAVLRALDEAQAVLTDPMRRFRYDQALLARARGDQNATELPRHARAQEVGVGGATKTPSSDRTPASQRPSGPMPVVPPPPTAPAPQYASPSAHQHAPPAHHAPPSTAPGNAPPNAVVPPPVRRATHPATPMVGAQPVPPRAITPAPIRPPSVGSIAPGVQAPREPAREHGRAITPPPLRPASAPPGPASASVSASMPKIPQPPRVPVVDPATGEGHRLEALEARIEGLAREVGTLMGELERVTAAVQFAITHGETASRVPAEQMARALQTLGDTRAEVVSLMAQREEQADHWEVAAALWQRAVRASPHNPALYIRAATALLRAGTDLATAEALARQAIELNPDLPDGYATLGVITARRGG